MHNQSTFQWLARFGYAARGIVYVLVSGLALYSSVGGGGDPDSKSALQAVFEQPLGRIWLGLIAVGLLGFIAWRLTQALANADGHPDTLKGFGVRVGLLISAVVYSSLALYAANMALSIGGASGSDGESQLSAWLIEQPFGRYLLAGVGIAVVGAGIAQIIKGVGYGYHKYLTIPSTAGTAIDWICVYGLSARGVVFLITGVFFFYAAFAVDPDQAGGIAEALAWVRQLPFGAILYAVAAFGLLAFGLYGFVEAVYRHIRPPPVAAPGDAVRN
jgi:hypothetical protein